MISWLMEFLSVDREMRVEEPGVTDLLWLPFIEAP